MASLARNLIATTLVLAVGLGIGWRPAGSPAQWLAAAAMIVGFILAMSWLAAALGLLARSAEAANSFTMVLMFLPYVSTAFVPAQTMPRACAPSPSTSRSLHCRDHARPVDGPHLDRRQHHP